MSEKLILKKIINGTIIETTIIVPDGDDYDDVIRNYSFEAINDEMVNNFNDIITIENIGTDYVHHKDLLKCVQPNNVTLYEETYPKQDDDLNGLYIDRYTRSPPQIFHYQIVIFQRIKLRTNSKE